MKYRKALVALALAFALGLGVYYTSALAHPTNQGGDSVRRTTTSDDLWVWDDHTNYDTYVNIAQNDTDGWGSLNCRWGRGADGRCTGVNMVKTTEFGHAETIEIWDYCSSTGAYLGQWINGPGTQDDIRLNRCRLSGRSTWGQQKTVTHEIGHSLGFGHPPCTSYYKENSVMIQSGCSTRYKLHRSHDASDYYTRWIVQN